MRSIYLDTNIFLYLTDPYSPYHEDCNLLIEYCDINNISIYTSVETIQEIIYYTKNIGKLEKGIVLSKKVIGIISNLISIDTDTIKNYLKLIKLYRSSKLQSRDIIHYSVCMTDNIPCLITYDKYMKRFKKVSVFTPKEYINQNNF